MTSTAQALIDQLMHQNGDIERAIDSVNQHQELALTKNAALFMIEQMKIYGLITQVGYQYLTN